MNAGGWVLMIGAVGTVTAVFAWCLRKVLSTPGATEHIHSQADIDPHDQDT